jgi:hypothetical protein
MTSGGRPRRAGYDRRPAGVGPGSRHDVFWPPYWSPRARFSGALVRAVSTASSHGARTVQVPAFVASNVSRHLIQHPSGSRPARPSRTRPPGSSPPRRRCHVPEPTSLAEGSRNVTVDRRSRYLAESPVLSSSGRPRSPPCVASMANRHPVSNRAARCVPALCDRLRHRGPVMIVWHSAATLRPVCRSSRRTRQSNSRERDRGSDAIFQAAPESGFRRSPTRRAPSAHPPEVPGPPPQGREDRRRRRGRGRTRELGRASLVVDVRQLRRRGDETGSMIRRMPPRRCRGRPPAASDSAGGAPAGDHHSPIPRWSPCLRRSTRQGASETPRDPTRSGDGLTSVSRHAIVGSGTRPTTVDISATPLELVQRRLLGSAQAELVTLSSSHCSR